MLLSLDNENTRFDGTAKASSYRVRSRARAREHRFPFRREFIRCGASCRESALPRLYANDFPESPSSLSQCRTRELRA